MTFNNSVLLILKQNNGIEFNDLLSRISPRYKNRSSAFSALSRSLKNLESLGKIKRKNSSIFITDKGLASIHIEMREKLVLKLNEAMKDPVNNLEEIVQLLIVFTERANESKDLLLNARENALFSIKDLSDLQDKIEFKKEFLDKMASLIGVQEERLRELNFNDNKTFVFDNSFVSALISFSGIEKIFIETINPELEKKLPSVFRKDNSFVIENDFKQKIFDIILSEILSDFVLYLPRMKIFVSKGKANCFALHEDLKAFEKELSH